MAHCGDPNPHSPHTYYGPSTNPKETKQVAYSCPGTPDKKKDNGKGKGRK